MVQTCLGIYSQFFFLFIKKKKHIYNSTIRLKPEPDSYNRFSSSFLIKSNHFWFYNVQEGERLKSLRPFKFGRE